MGMNNQTEILLESGTNELEIMEFTVGGEILASMSPRFAKL